MRLLIAAVFVTTLAAVAVYAQNNPMRAGQWEVGMQMQMAGMQMPEFKTTQCITQEQLQKDPTSGLPTGARDSNPSACKVSDYKQTGNTVAWKMACAGQQPMTGEGELTFAGDAYTGTIMMNMAQGAMAMKMSGKRLGDCPR